MSTEVRLFRPSDAGALSVVIRKCLIERNSKDYGPEIIDRMTAHFTPETLERLALEREMWVGERDGMTVGTVSRDGDKVYTLFVEPDVSGQGVGGRLMDHVEQLAIAEGYGYMETGASITAHDFYRNRGYADVRESETDFGRNYILRKKLNRG